MPKKEIPKKSDIPRKTLKEILTNLKVDEKQINKLTKPIQELLFIDNYVKKEEEPNNILKLTNHNIITDEENYLYINFKDSTLEYHEIINGTLRIREYTKNGFDISLLKQL